MSTDSSPVTPRDDHFIYVYPYLYLGDETVANDLAILEELDINVIFRIGEGKDLFPKNVDYISIAASESELFFIEDYFKQVREVIDDCKDRGKRVLLHGYSILGFPAIMVMSYIMQNEKVTLEDAARNLRSKGLGRFGTSERNLSELLKLEIKILGRKFSEVVTLTGDLQLDVPSNPWSSLGSTDDELDSPIVVGRNSSFVDSDLPEQRGVNLKNVFVGINGLNPMLKRTIAHFVDIFTIILVLSFSIYIIYLK